MGRAFHSCSKANLSRCWAASATTFLLLTRIVAASVFWRGDTSCRLRRRDHATALTPHRIPANSQLIILGLFFAGLINTAIVSFGRRGAACVRRPRGLTEFSSCLIIPALLFVVFGSPSLPTLPGLRGTHRRAEAILAKVSAEADQRTSPPSPSL